MKVERTLAEWAAETTFDELPAAPVDLMKTLVLTIVGTTVAGAAAEGCGEVVDLVRKWGGAEEATIHLYGGKVPAHHAVLANSAMARAFDICDGSDPGIHIGSTAVPVALAMAELTGGCTGEDFLAALAVGSELTARLSFVAHYDGFDPTGIGTVFAAAAIAGRMLHLDTDQMLHALALAFNRAGGSFQSNIDGSLAVRLIQSFVSENGIVCAQLAQRGITGPENFVEGRFGYYHLYANDERDDVTLIDGLGDRWAMSIMGFKSYPSCGATIASTDAILELIRAHPIDPDDVDRVDVTVSSPCFALVGHDFEVGKNPTVNAQFNLQYCIANGIVRKGSKLAHFDAAQVRDPGILELARRVNVHDDPNIHEGQRELLSRSIVTVTGRDGSSHTQVIDGASGFPMNPLSPDQHMERFRDNVGFGGKPLTPGAIDTLVDMIGRLETVDDARALVPLLVCGDDG